MGAELSTICAMRKLIKRGKNLTSPATMNAEK